MVKRIAVGLMCIFFLVHNVSVIYGAVGCTLNDPDRDVRRLFPEATNYKTDFITIKERGGEALAREVEEKLKDKLDTLYETIDAPYAYYTILKKKEIIGYIHGVNQKGMFGGMQLILATTTEGEIIAFYYQKISSPESKKFKDERFTDQFVGLTLADFYGHDDKVALISDPSENSHEDFVATLRGTKKNLILLDIFILDNKYDAVYNNSKGKEKDEDEK